MPKFPSLSLQRIDELTPTSKTEFLDALTYSIDIPFGNAKTGIELIEVFSKKLTYWAIALDDVPVGLFGIDTCLQLPQKWQTSTLILKAYRGQGVGPLLKLATAQVFLERDIPLVCLVRESNKPSLRSLYRAFPEIIPSQFVEIESVQFHVFDLSLVALKEIPSEAKHVAEIVRTWLNTLM